MDVYYVHTKYIFIIFDSINSKLSQIKTQSIYFHLHCNFYYHLMITLFFIFYYNLVKNTLNINEATD